MIKRNHNQSGFTLLEALLTTAVLSGIFVILFSILEDYSEQVLMRSTSNYMEQLASSIENILQQPEFFSDIYAEADAQANDIIDGITPADILAGTIGTLTLPNTSLLNATFKNTTPLKTGVSIMIRATGGDSLEIIIATDAPRDDKRVRTAAEFSKLNGGFYRNVADGVVHSYNAWRIDLADLLGTAWHTFVTTAANVPSPVNGSYLVNYRHISFDEIAGDYLYRTRVPGRPEINTLYGDLNMGGQNILGADNVNVANNIEMDSRAIVNGSANITGSANFIGGNFRTSGVLSTQNATINSTLGGTTGNFIVQDELTTNDLNLASTNAITANFNSGLETSASLSSINISSIQDIQSVNINATNLNTLGTGAIDINAQTADLIAQSITTPSLSVGGTNAVGINDAIVDNANLNNIAVDFLIIDNLDVNTFGTCEKGC